MPVPKDDPLYLLAEATQEWSVDRKGLVEPMPRLEGMTLSENQGAALERKLYIKNTGHFSIGILGFRKGYALMDQAARDPEVFALVDQVTRESAWSVATKHRFDLNWIEDEVGGKPYGVDFAMPELAPEAFTASIVFAGYGIHASDLGYDDFAGLDPLLRAQDLQAAEQPLAKELAVTLVLAC